jgi:hypothetical protein
MDKDTQEIISQAQYIKDMIESDGWRIAKRRLVEFAVKMTSTNILDKTKSDTAIVKELRANERAQNIIIKWLAEIEGAVDHGKYLAETLANHEKEEIIEMVGE